jgi:hypothetical protein
MLIDAKLLDTSIGYKQLWARTEIQTVSFYHSLSGAMSGG